MRRGRLPGAEIVRLLVGSGKAKREFAIHEKLLCASSSFFREELDAMSSVPSTPEGQLPAAHGQDATTVTTEIMWFSEESPEMFEFFILWLYQRNSFRALLHQMTTTVTAKPGPHTTAENSRRALHWNLVRLHLFAAVVRLPALQDIAMDAIQDLYLQCDWDVSHRFVRFLYGECTREQSFRLRKWAVAMLAWTVDSNNGGGEAGEAHPFAELFDELPELWGDYLKHTDKMASSRTNARVKNPQLRLHANRLRNEERHFGFRQCSFHSHRSAVGEGRCPHTLDQQLLSPTVDDFGHADLGRGAGARAAAHTPKPSSKRGGRMRSASDSMIWTVHESTEET